MLCESRSSQVEPGDIWGKKVSKCLVQIIRNNLPYHTKLSQNVKVSENMIVFETEHDHGK